MLKKAIIILLMSTFVFSTTEFCQLLKLPMLITHFQEHKAEKSDLSFFSFLKMHYFNGDPKDADDETDMKLPFKTTCIEHHVSVFVQEELTFWDSNFVEKTKITPFFQHIRLFSEQHVPSSSYLTCIWQPPQ
jgi:hypothetical protein